jgi:tRNA(fMet)-specific endonuclease VapC
VKYLLDTDTCIHIVRENGPHRKKLLKTQPEKVRISIMTLYELEVGLAKANLKTPKQSVVKKRERLENLLRYIEVIPFEKNEAAEAAKILAELEAQGQPIGSIDYLIAATARLHGFVLVTGNLSEFQRVRKLKLANWSEGLT